MFHSVAGPKTRHHSTGKLFKTISKCFLFSNNRLWSYRLAVAGSFHFLYANEHRTDSLYKRIRNGKSLSENAKQEFIPKYTELWESKTGFSFCFMKKKKKTTKKWKIYDIIEISAIDPTTISVKFTLIAADIANCMWIAFVLLNNESEKLPNEGDRLINRQMLLFACLFTFCCCIHDHSRKLQCNVQIAWLMHKLAKTN